MKKHLAVIPLILILVVALAACASFTKTSYVTLHTSGDVYATAMQVVADLQGQGYIDQEKRNEINQVAKIYKEAHNAAVAALEIYVITKAAPDKDKLTMALIEVSVRWLDVAKLINAIKPGLVPMTLGGGAL